MIAAFNERNRQEKVDRSRHAYEIGGGLNRGAGHESRKAGRRSWRHFLLSDAAFHGSAVTRQGRTAPDHRVGGRVEVLGSMLAGRDIAAAYVAAA